MNQLEGANTSYFNPQILRPAVPPQENLGKSDLSRQTDRSSETALNRRPHRIRPDGQSVFNAEIGRQAIDRDVAEIQGTYGFLPEHSVRAFLLRSGAIRKALRDAIPHLRETFGVDTLFNLEISRDDESPILYAVAVCRGTVQDAASALLLFEELAQAGVERRGGIARDAVVGDDGSALLDDLTRRVEALDASEAGALEPAAHLGDSLLEGGHRRPS